MVNIDEIMEEIEDVLDKYFDQGGRNHAALNEIEEILEEAQAD